ncbi:MAG: gamma-glutamylcyclotransferase [Alcanivorax sp.]|nr:gamma-glutamylcyclotransferase [Alcanivorax sp.]
MLVFVYGTLKRGERNHHFLKRGCYLADWRTPPCFMLFDLGAYPGLCRPGNTAVWGELYEVNSAIMAQLDRLEEVPRVYRREWLATPWGRAVVYVLQRRPRGAVTLAEGRWP